MFTIEILNKLHLIVCILVKGQCHEIFSLRCFHQITSPGPNLKVRFWIFSYIGIVIHINKRIPGVFIIGETIFELFFLKRLWHVLESLWNNFPVFQATALRWEHGPVMGLSGSSCSRELLYFANNFDELPAALVYSSLEAETSWGWMCTLKSYLWLQNLNCFKAFLLDGPKVGKVVW